MDAYQRKEVGVNRDTRILPAKLRLDTHALLCSWLVLLFLLEQEMQLMVKCTKSREVHFLRQVQKFLDPLSSCSHGNDYLSSSLPSLKCSDKLDALRSPNGNKRHRFVIFPLALPSVFCDRLGI